MRTFKIYSLRHHFLLPSPSIHPAPDTWASPSSHPGPLIVLTSPSPFPGPSLSSLSLHLDPRNGHELARAAPAGGKLSQGGRDTGHTLSAQPHGQRCPLGPHLSSLSSIAQVFPTSPSPDLGIRAAGSPDAWPSCESLPILGPQFPPVEECIAKCT